MAITAGYANKKLNKKGTTSIEKPKLGSKVNVTTSDSMGTRTITGIVKHVDDSIIKVSQKVVIYNQIITGVEDVRTRTPITDLGTLSKHKGEVIVKLATGEAIQGYFKSFPNNSLLEFEITVRAYRGISTVIWV